MSAIAPDFDARRGIMRERIRHATRAAAHHAWRAGWTLPPRLNVWEWADRYRTLTRETSKEPGEWRTDRTPYLREIMWSLSVESPVIQVSFVSGTQLGKTEVGNNFVGYVIGHAGSSILVVQPTGDMAMRWSRQRLDVMIETTAQLRARIAPARSRDANNTAKMKRYPGGYLIIGQAESAASLSSLPARFVFMDEVDSYPLDVDGEGDPVTIAERRTDSFGRRRKIFLVSSAKKLLGASIIWREYQRSDRRLYHVPCPRCDHRQALEFENILPTGEYLCAHCGQGIPHTAKTDLLQAGEWVASHPERSNSHRGYRLPSLYAPVGLGPTWKDLFEDRQKAADDPVQIKTFVSTRCAEPWEQKEGKIEPEDLKGIREDWHMREVPDPVLMVTAAVDVQKSRFHVTLFGFSRGPQVWLLDRAEIPGSPVEPAAWDELEEYIDQPLVNRWGVEIYPMLTAVDSGNWTQEVYTACRERQHKGWVPVKGHSQRGHPVIGRPRLVDVNIAGRTLRQGLRLYLIGVDTAKDTMLDRLAITPDKVESERWIHLPADLPDEWFDQITSERKDPETDAWVKVRPGARNEDIDVLVYGFAAACHPKCRLLKLREADWLRKEERLHPAVNDLFQGLPAAAVQEKRAPVVTAKPAPRPTRRPLIR